MQTPKQTASRVGFALAGFLLVTDVLFLAFLYLWGRGGPVVLSELQYTFLYDGVMYLVAAPVFLLLLRRVPKQPEPPRQRLRMTPRRFLVVLMLCVGASMVASLLAGLWQTLLTRFLPIGLWGWLRPGVYMRGSMGEGWRFLFLVILPPLGEEYLFRVALRRRLRGCGDLAYILISGVGFGLCHTSLRQNASAMVAGFLLAWLYLRTGRYIWPVLVHMGNNLLSYISGLPGNESAKLLIGLFGFASILLSIALLATAGRDERRALLAPRDLGWPYCPPKKAQRPWLYAAPPPTLLPPAPGHGFGPAAQHPAWCTAPYTPAQTARQAPRPRTGLVRACFGNPGMLCFLLLAIGATLALLFA